MRINIIVCVPSIEREYDLSVPDSLPVEQLITLVSKGVSEMSNGYYSPTGDEYLCAAPFDLPLDREITLAEYHIENGDRLFLL